MSVVDRKLDEVTIRIGLKKAGDYALVTIKKDKGKLRLDPVRYLGSQSSEGPAVEWYLRFNNPEERIEVTIEINYQGNKTTQKIELDSTHGVYALGLGELKKDFILLQGSISLPVGGAMAETLARLWPIHGVEYVKRILFEPSGLHVQGLMPREFYAPALNPGIPKIMPLITLRVPQASPKGSLSLIFDQIFEDFRPVGDGRDFWLCTAFDFPVPGAENLTAIDYVKQWLDYFQAFRITGNTERDNFIDNVRTDFTRDCALYIFRPPVEPHDRVLWVGQNLGARMVLGGGSVAEAEFAPQFLTGRMDEEGQSNWKRKELNFKTLGAEVPAFKPSRRGSIAEHVELSLTRSAAPAIETSNTKIDFNPITMQALFSAGAQLLEAPAPPAGETSAGINTDATKHFRSWLCMNSGWLALDSTQAQAKIDTGSIGQGSVAGVIELDKLVRSLLPRKVQGRSPGLTVQASVLPQTLVTVGLTPDVNGTSNGEKLSLKLHDPMITIITPAVWFEKRRQKSSPEELTWNLRELPRLTATRSAGSPTAGSAAESQVTVSPEALPETFLQECLSPATFVSNNVIAPVPFVQKVEPGKRWRLMDPENERIFEIGVNGNQLTVRQSSAPERDLFKVNFDLVRELNNGTLPELLQRHLERVVSLATPSKPRTAESNRRWLFDDQDNERHYQIVKDGNQLRVEQLIGATTRVRTSVEANIMLSLDQEQVPSLLHERFAAHPVGPLGAERQGVPVSAALKPTPEKDDFSLAFLQGPLGNSNDGVNQTAIFWSRLPGLPVVQTFPFSTTHDEDSYLDSNRGLLPFRPDSNKEIPVIFGGNELPANPEPDGIKWPVASDLVHSHYFLPTLPGVELTLANPLNWDYRHSVPALDEAYAEVRENENDKSQPGLLNDIDYTRVVDTKAFSISTPNVAEGWLHKTTQNKKGQVAIQIDNANLTGLDPKLSLKIKNLIDDGQTETRTLSRRENTGGIRLPIKVEPSAGTALALPDFKITINKNSSQEIVNNGQPLIVVWDEQVRRVVILDGQGHIGEEPLSETVRERDLGEGSDRARRYETYELSPDAGPVSISKLTLEVLGVPSSGVPRLNREELYVQSWMLHDGKGGWPRLFGFPVFPLALEEFSREAATPSIKLSGIWLPQEPEAGTAGAPPTAGGRIVMTFEFKSGAWKLAGLSGELDWRFERNPDEQTDLFSLLRLQGQVNWADAGTPERLPITLTSMTLGHPVGLIELRDFKSVKCEIDRNTGPLMIVENAQIDSTTGDAAFLFTLKETAIRNAAAPDLVGYEFTWQFNVTQADLGTDQNTHTLKLKCENASAPPRARWSLKVETIDKRAVIETRLAPNAAGPAKLLFSLAAAGQNILFSEGAWLKPERAANGIVGVVFDLGAESSTSPTNPSIQELVGDVHLLLTDLATTIISQPTKLSARWMFNYPKTGSKKTLAGQFEVSGRLKVRNQIGFQDGKDIWPHEALLFFDRARLKAADMFTILSGVAPDSEIEIGVVAHHFLQVGSKINRAEFQAVQTVRLMSLGRFARRFLPAGHPSGFPDVLFDKNKDSINNDAARAVLRKALEALNANPTRTIVIDGHADHEDDEQNRADLSGRRAATVKNWFIANGVGALRITRTRAYGASQQLFPKVKDEKRNRRVELRFNDQFAETLVIEGGAVFWLRPIVLAEPAIGALDLGNELVRVSLLPRPQLLPANEKDGESAAVVRLPLVSGSHLPPLIINMRQTTVDAAKLYGTSGAQWMSALTAPAAQSTGTTDSKDADGARASFDVLHRTPQARWLSSSFLSSCVHFDGGEYALPAFVDSSGNKPTWQLPAELGDLLWFKSHPGSRPAAALISPYRPGGETQLLTSTTLLEFPFQVREKALVENEHQGHVQLVRMESGLIRRVAQDNLTSESELSNSTNDLKTKIEEWALGHFQAKSISGGAFVLRAFSDYVYIPPPIDLRRITLAQLPSWALEKTPAFDGKLDASPLDGDRRRRLPRKTANEKAEDRRAIFSRPDQSNSLLVFGAYPQEPPKSSNTKGVAATRFRLAPAKTEAANWAGHLRPARSAATRLQEYSVPNQKQKDYLLDEGEMTGCTRWDQVPFEQTEESAADSVGRSYPAIPPQVLNRRASLLDQLDETAVSNEESETVSTVVPPLIDVVAWAARPGERMRSQWSLDQAAVKDPQMAMLLSGNQVALDLRRPRAVPGSTESVSLEQLKDESRTILGGLFRYAKFKLTQVIGSTDVPTKPDVYGVVASKSDLFVSRSSSALANSNPAVFYVDEDKSKKKSIRAISLYLVANEKFDPTSGGESSRLFLFLSTDGEAPVLKPTDSFCGDATATHSVLSSQIPKLGDGNGWRRLSDAATNPPKSVFYLPIDSIRDHIQCLLGRKEIPQLHLILARYKLTTSGWERTETIFVTQLAFVSSAGIIVAPKMSLSLLAHQAASPTQAEKTWLSGYGRLDDRSFSPIEPAAVVDSSVRWIRAATLQTIERSALWQIESGEAEITYDAVLYGSGGEFLPTMANH